MDDVGNPKLKEIGSQIRKLRNQKGWTIEALANEANLSTPQISEIERGLRDAQITTYMKIADALGVNIAVLFPPYSSSEKMEDDFIEIYGEIMSMDSNTRTIFLKNIKSLAFLVNH